MSLLGRLFGSEKVIDAAKSGIDAAFYTDQEKAEQFAVLLKLYEPFKLAQRLIALIFCGCYALAWIVTFGALFVVDDPLTLEPLSAMLRGDMGSIVMIITGFYFAGGMINTFKK